MEIINSTIKYINNNLALLYLKSFLILSKKKLKLKTNKYRNNKINDIKKNVKQNPLMITGIANAGKNINIIVIKEKKAIILIFIFYLS